MTGVQTCALPICECRNDNSIGVELCCKKKDMTSRRAEDKDWYFESKTIENAAELIKYLMSVYDIPIENVVRHYDVTHKICPAPFVHNESEWNKFKERLRGDDEMVTETYIKVNGKDIKINRILKDGKNYIDIRGLENAGFEVGYDAGSKVPSLSVKAEKVTMCINGEEKEVSRILKFDENYVRLRDLADILDIDYVDGKVAISAKS